MSDEIHHLHHLEFHQLVLHQNTMSACPNLGIESENNEHNFYAEIFDGLFPFFVEFLIAVHDFEGAWSLGCPYRC